MGEGAIVAGGAARSLHPAISSNGASTAIAGACRMARWYGTKTPGSDEGGATAAGFGRAILERHHRRRLIEGVLGEPGADEPGHRLEHANTIHRGQQGLA